MFTWAKRVNDVISFCLLLSKMGANIVEISKLYIRLCSFWEILTNMTFMTEGNKKVTRRQLKVIMVPYWHALAISYWSSCVHATSSLTAFWSCLANFILHFNHLSMYWLCMTPYPQLPSLPFCHTSKTVSMKPVYGTLIWWNCLKTVCACSKMFKWPCERGYKCWLQCKHGKHHFANLDGGLKWLVTSPLAFRGKWINVESSLPIVILKVPITWKIWIVLKFS